MTAQLNSDIIVYLCKNSVPNGEVMPPQWSEAALHVRVKELPCSGKIDVQYILHALEGGVRGVCIITCPKGTCTLSQGNYRAGVRVRTAQRLLDEIGSNSARVELINTSGDESVQQLTELINGMARRIATITSAAHPRGAEIIAAHAA